MPLQFNRAAAIRFLHFTLGIWLGIYAFRAFVPTAVWNLSDALPLALKGALAIGVHAIGIAGCILPLSKRRNSVVWLAVAVAVLGTLRQIFMGGDITGSALSLIGWIVWLWWLSATARQVGSEDARLLAAAFATGLSLQVGMQAAWHGLDLPMAGGVVAIICALAVNACFALTAFQWRGSTAGGVSSSRVFCALGIAFFLELTWLANVGRIGVINDWGLLPSALLIQAGLVLGMLVATTRLSSFGQLTAIAVLLLSTATAARMDAASGAVLALTQAAVIVLVFASARPQRSAVGSFLIGAIALFVFVFLFYNWYELPGLWLAGALALTLCVLPIKPYQPLPRYFAVAPAFGAALSVMSLLSAYDTEGHSRPDRLRLLSYNIHQGFDAAGVPAMQSIADEIGAHDADVIALQEVGRGWTFVGGADLVAYLRYRFPHHVIHFVPVNGQLWGVALMSKLPIDSLSGAAFESAPHAFRYGYAAGTVHTGAARVRVASVHLTAGLEGNGADSRSDQIDQLLRIVAAYDDAIIAGDLNTHPTEPPMERVAAAGFTDAGAAAGIAALATWPAHRPNERIDYVLTRGALRPVGATVKPTSASDHLPVMVEFARDASR